VNKQQDVGQPLTRHHQYVTSRPHFSNTDGRHQVHGRAALSHLKHISLIEMIALMMEVAGTSETSVHFCQTTRRNNPEDSHLSFSTFKLFDGKV
jgi:hypothetical protein